MTRVKRGSSLLSILGCFMNNGDPREKPTLIEHILMNYIAVVFHIYFWARLFLMLERGLSLNNQLLKCLNKECYYRD